MGRVRRARARRKTRLRRRLASPRHCTRTPSQTALPRAWTESGDTSTGQRRRHLRGRSALSGTPVTGVSHVPILLTHTGPRCPAPSAERSIPMPRPGVSSRCASSRTAFHKPRLTAPQPGASSACAGSRIHSHPSVVPCLPCLPCLLLPCLPCLLTRRLAKAFCLQSQTRCRRVHPLPKGRTQATPIATHPHSSLPEVG